MRETLKDILEIGPKNFGVFGSKVSRTMKLADGHTITTSFDGQVDDCGDEAVLPAMAARAEVTFAAKKDNSRLSQKLSGVVAAARNGHGESLTWLEGQKAKKAAPAAKPIAVTV